MKGYKIIYLLILFTSLASGQVKKQIDIPFQRGLHGIMTKDTTIFYKWVTECIKQMHLTNLVYSQQQFHIRLWSDNNVIDIWSDDGKTFNGSLINYIIKEPKTKKSNNNELYYDKDKVYNNVKIDTAIARKVVAIFNTLSITNIPTEDSIVGWGKPDSNGIMYAVSDGREFWLEYSTPKIYSLKIYSDPEFFKNIKEAVIIDTMINQFNESLKGINDWDNFVNNLPPGNYINGIVQINIMAIHHKKKKKLNS